MPAAGIPRNEQARLRALRAYDILDTTCDAAFDEITELAARLSGSPIALITLVDQERQWFKSRIGLEMTETPRDMAFCAHAILQPDEPLIVEDATADARFADNPLVTDAPNIRFYAGIPLVNPDGHALGTLCVIDKKPRRADGETVRALRILARTVVTTLELRRAMRQMRCMALTDSLTGLANRAGLLQGLTEALERLRQEHVPFTLIAFDLDGFKRVNDEMGHAEGDQLLAEVASVLETQIRSRDLAARFGGDEFAVVLAGSARLDGAAAGERIRHALQERMAERGWPVTASIGAMTFLDAPASVEDVLAAVDELTYKAKRAGRNRVFHREHSERIALRA